MDNQTQVHIRKLPVDYSLVRDVFKKFASAGLNVDMISIIDNGSDLALSFTIVEDKKKYLQTAIKRALKDLRGYDIEYNSGYAKVSVVGVGMKTNVGVAADFFGALKNIPIRLVTTSEIIISCLVEAKYKQDAVTALAKKFKL